MKNSLFTIGCLLLTLSACAGEPSASPTPAPSPALPTATAAPTPAGPFDYDSAVPFDTKVISETEREGVTIVDLNYAAHDPTFSPTTGGGQWPTWSNRTGRAPSPE